MPKKIKHGARRPPLSVLDKCLYFVLFVITFFLTIILWIFLAIEIPWQIAFSDPNVIASTSDSLPISAILFSFTVGMGSNILVISGWRTRQPLFGNPKYKPKLFEPTMKVYPLFSKQFLQDRTEKQRAKIRKTTHIILALILILALLTSLSFCKRIDLTRDLQFVRYNSFNVPNSSRDMRSAEKLIISIERTHHRHGFSYYISMQFIYPDDTYELDFGRFRGIHWGGESTLQQMLYIKGFFDGRYALEDVNRIARLCRNFNSAEKALIYDLFDYSP